MIFGQTVRSWRCAVQPRIRTNRFGPLRAVVMAIIMIIACYAQPIEAKSSFPVFFSWGEETIVKIADFPDTPDFQTKDENYFDAGVIYKQITIFFLPLWNYDVRWTGYIDSDYYVELSPEEMQDFAVELSPEEMQDFAVVAEVSLSQAPALPFWDRYGGKLILLVLLAVLLLVAVASKSDDT